MLSEQQQRIMGYFIEEAKDHLNTIEQGLLNLQATIADPEMANEVFRAAHSVKGGAAMLGLTSIQNTAHRLEDYFKILKDCPVTIDQKLESLLLRVYDTLQELLEQLQGPFGLTDDKAEESMAAVEPVFTELNQHLGQLVSQSGAQPPEDVNLVTVANAAAQTKVEIPLSQVTSEESALRFIFQNDVPARLREILQLFKQADTPASRQQMQDLCQGLARSGEQLDLSGWCDLMTTAQRAIGNMDYSYKVLAPLVIKDIKRAQEQILTGNTNVVASEELIALLPEEAAIVETALESEPDLTDLFGSGDADDLGLFDADAFDADAGAFDVGEEMTLPELSFEDEFSQESSDLNLDFAALGFDATDSGIESWDFNSSAADEEIGSGLLNKTGPEVGMAELNSLADLFEGEEPDLELNWQEEVISGREQSAAPASEAEGDFSDLLFPDQSEDLLLEEAEDLSGLLNGTQDQAMDTGAIDFNLGDDEQAAAEDLFLDLADLESLDAGSDDENPFAMFTAEAESTEVGADNSSDGLSDFDALFTGVTDSDLDNSGVEAALEGLEANGSESLASHGEDHESSSGDLFAAEIDSAAALSELDLNSELSGLPELDLSDLTLEGEDAPTSDLAIDEFDLFGPAADSGPSDLNFLDIADSDGLDDLSADADFGFESLNFDNLEQEASGDLAASTLDDLGLAEVSEETDLDLQSVLEEGAGDGGLDFFNAIDISELEPFEEAVPESVLQMGGVEAEPSLPQPLSDPWTEAEDFDFDGQASELAQLELAQPVDETADQAVELVSLDSLNLDNPLDADAAMENLSWQDEASLIQPAAADEPSFGIEEFNLADFSLDGVDLGEEEILDSSELVAFHLDDPEIGSDDLGISFDAAAENGEPADFKLEGWPEERGSLEDLSLASSDGTEMAAWSAIEPLDDGNDRQTPSDLDLNWFADHEELAAQEMAGEDEFTAESANLNEAFGVDLAENADAIPAESIDLAAFELSDDLVVLNEEGDRSEDGFNWFEAEASEMPEAEQANLDWDGVALDGAIDSALFETADDVEAADFDLALSETPEDLFGDGAENTDGLALADLTDGFELGSGLEADGSIDPFDLDFGSSNPESPIDEFDVGLRTDQTEDLAADFDLDEDSAILADSLGWDVNRESANLPANEFDLGLEATEVEGLTDDFGLDLSADAEGVLADDDLSLVFEESDVEDANSANGLAEGFELDFGSDGLEGADETSDFELDFGAEVGGDGLSTDLSSEQTGDADADFDLFSAANAEPDLFSEETGDFELDFGSEGSEGADETSDFELDFGAEVGGDGLSADLFSEQTGDVDADFDLFADADAEPLTSGADESSDGLGLAGLGLVAGSALFGANAAMNDSIDQFDVTHSSSDLDDPDFLLAESGDREDAMFDALDFGLADLEPEAVEIEPTELTEPIVLESELEDLDGFLNLESSDFSIDADPAPLNFGIEDWDRTLTDESSEMDDLDALLSEQDGAEPVAFDDLEAVLAEDSFPVTAIHEDLPAEMAAEFDDFADLDALLEEPSPTETFTEMADVSAVPVSAKVEAEDEFSDLEALLQDADQTLGIGASPARKSPATANRRPNRRNGLSEQTMRVSVKHLDNLNNLVGEMVVNRNSLEQAEERLRQFLDNLLYQVQQLSDVGQRMRDLYERSLLESSLLSSRRGQSVSTTISGLHFGQSSHATGASFDALEMDRFTGFHTLSQEMIELIVRVRESASDIDFVVEETDQVTRNFRQITTQLQEGLTRSRMVPFSQTADRLPRGVRDNSLKYGKQAELVIEGRDTLIDKMIVELLYDPMTHLVNNAIAHGIETPEQRIASGKPPTGRITIRTFHQGNQTVISVSDDGAGINPETVRAKALAKGVITAVQAREMSRLDTYDLLFHHGFSTVDQADDLRGRGVGLDVVRNNLNEIRGTINIDSVIGKGTTFTIRLPLTLSISKALCCISNRARIAFPMDGVEDMLDVPRERIQRDEQGRQCIQWRDILLPFQPLAELLRYNRVLGRGSVYGGNQEEDIISIVVLRSAGNFLALQVDQVLGEQEIVIKQLEGPVPKPIGVAGATVLGDGRIMPIADVLELIDLWQGRIRREPGALLWDKGDQLPPEPMAASEPTVLIVDDSITVRELLSMTFSKVGYRVEQARDGQEAWEKLRAGLPCDLVFCDIEMPRMDGLELLSRIQKDPHLNHLPIAMLTSRGADRHRQMAVQLGAKGYFTKPYLEEMLLDAAQRMLKGEVMVLG